MVHLKRKGAPHDSQQDPQSSSAGTSRAGEALGSGARSSSTGKSPSGRSSSGQEDEDRGGASEVGSSTHIPSQRHPSSSDTTHMPSPATLRPILFCPLCTTLLRNPTTLRCGHSLCAHHLTDPARQAPAHTLHAPTNLPLCPLPACTANSGPSSALPRIPTGSHVRYRPAPPPTDLPSSAQPATVPESRLDVTLNKVLVLVARTNHALEVQEPVPDSGKESDQDSPSYASSSAHDRSSLHPHKRRRRHLTHRREDEGEEDDLLTHLRKQAIRERVLRHDEPILPSSHDTPSSPSKDAIFARFEKDLLVELTCEICFFLLYQPITTPCQHTFCAKCLQRSLDHSSTCPLCRQDLPGFAYFQDHPTNKTLLSIILQGYPMGYKERGEALASEERDARLDTPIFVCQLSFPGMPTLLHFFEPRYRLMLRRCLESPNPHFGMIMPPKPGSGSPQVEYGTILEIRSVQMLPDGRSMVEAWGSFRFRILERGTLDGYMVGRIERIDDYPEDLSASAFLFPSDPADASHASLLDGSSSSSQPSTSPSSPQPTTRPSSPRTPPPLSIPLHPTSPTNEDLMTTCRSFLDRLQRGTAPWVVQRLSSTYGAMPTDPSAFSFWVALVLPIDEHEKAKLLPLRSARLRLLVLVHWIEQLSNQWWFSSGCTVL